MLQPISEHHSFSWQNHTNMALTELCHEGECNMTEKAAGGGGEGGRASLRREQIGTWQLLLFSVGCSMNA